MPHHRESLVHIIFALAITLFCGGVLRAEPAPSAGSANPQGSPQWVALWQDAYKGADPHFDPEKPGINAFADRTTGDAYLAGWDMGVWESTDGGRQFVRIDGGKITGPACGPIMPYSAFVSPEGKKIAIFNMWNVKGPSGFSLDGGKTWGQFTNVGRDWDFGAIDWDSHTVFGARHEEVSLHVSTDDGKTWTKLARSRVDPMVTGLGVVDDKTLLLATDHTIERSEDCGKTWNVVSDLGAIGPTQKFNGKLWWLSQRDSIITSSDGGKTWQVQGQITDGSAASGKALRGPFCGPIFGKDENDIVMVNDSGFYETTDGCKNWKLITPLPDGYSIGRGACSAAYDPVHEVFYLTNFRHPVMRFIRNQPPEYITPTIPVKAEGGEGGGPAAKFIELSSPKPLRVLNVLGMDMNAGFLYVCTEDGLIWLKPDAQSGTLSLAGRNAEARSLGFDLKCINGRLYGVTPHNGYHRISWHGLAWFDLDPKTGKANKVGIVDCEGSRQMIVGPEQHDLYLKSSMGAHDKIYWYRIGDDGKPAKAGEVSGKGIGASAFDDYPSIMRLSLDGKFLYAISAKDYAIACIARKPSGELAYVNSTSLDGIAKSEPDNYNHQYVSLNLSPDGKWLYAQVRNGKPTDNFYGIFERDAATGALTLSETRNGAEDALANLPAWEMCFSPKGDGGFLGSWIGPLVSFKYDPATGRLIGAAAIEGTDRLGSDNLFYDQADGLLFAGGGDYGVNPRGVAVLKLQR